MLKNKTSFLIQKIISDTEMILSEKPETEVKNMDYMVQPKIDQNEMYMKVWEKLKEGAMVGIFPEGGSHDRPDILPLKAGICIMALGGKKKYALDPAILACGINYYRPHKFRSKVILEYGKKFNIKDEIYELFVTDKRQAITRTLLEIENKMKEVKLTVPSYKALTEIYTIRSLYLPQDNTITRDQKLYILK